MCADASKNAESRLMAGQGAQQVGMPDLISTLPEEPN